MDTSFLVNLILSFLTGSIFVTLSTILGERFGSRIGGLIGGLPSTVVVAFFFIGLSQSPEAAFQATSVFPLIYAFTGLFLLFYALLAKKGFFISLVISLCLWFGLSFIVILIRWKSFLLAFLLYILIACAAFFIFQFRLKLPLTGKLKLKYTPKQIIGRALFSGSMIAFAVLSSKLGGPVYGGIFSAFPAVFISILIISFRSHGIDLSRAMTKPLFITGMISVVLYATAIRYFYLSLGLVWGTVCAYLISLVGASLSLFLQKKLQ
jgi:hypothetical protein